MVVYVDVLFLVNLTFDLLAVYLVAKYSETKLYPLLSLVGCVIGSLYGVWALLYCRRLIFALLLAPAVLALQCYLAFRPGRWESLLRLSIIMLVAMILTGAVAYQILRFSVFRLGVVKDAQNDGKVVLFSFISVFTGAALSVSSYFLKRQRNKKTVLVSAVVGDVTIRCECLVDSGNLVRDPTDGQAVVFVPLSAFFGKMKREHLGILCDGAIGQIDVLPAWIKRRIRLVPGKTIEGSTILLCLRADRLTIDGTEKRALLSIIKQASKRSEGICPLSIIA